MGAELFHADGQTHRQTDEQLDGQTDRDEEANSQLFYNFTNLPKS